MNKVDQSTLSTIHCFTLLCLFTFLFSFPCFSNTTPGLTTLNGQFVDSDLRTRFLRGINLAGSSKLPMTWQCEQATTLCKEVSFVGRPMALEDADLHFQRIHSWGFNLIRLLVTWEALEHLGPKQYDQAYIDYLKAIIAKANANGLMVMIDPHQDVWSRFTGGDGAPLWTLEVVGFNVNNFNQTNAALVFDQGTEKIPEMIWPTNYSKLASATMFTLFFAGDDFAPLTIIDDVNIKTYLQQHYIGAFQHLANQLKESSNVIGFEVMNEPHPGWIGVTDLTSYTQFPLRNQLTPTPKQAIALGAGYSQTVANWHVATLGIEHQGDVLVNVNNISAWQTPEQDVWLTNGVWKQNNGHFVLNAKDYFATKNNQPVNFSQDYYRPFIHDFAKAIRSELPEALIFIEKPFHYPMPVINELERTVNATHWYDQITLIKKRFWSWLSLDLNTGSPIIGGAAIEQHFTEQVQNIMNLASALNEHSPTLIGEVGIPFDLNEGESFASTSLINWDFTLQNLALNRSLVAMENAQVNYAIWNYTPDNNNKNGDLWNGEDLSIFSQSQYNIADVGNINSGGRALRAAIRPFAMAINGDLIASKFNMQTGRFDLHFIESEQSIKTSPSIIFLPQYYFGQGYTVQLSDGELLSTEKPNVWHYFASQTLKEHTITITPSAELAIVSKTNWWLIISCSIVALITIKVIRVYRRRSKLKRKQ